MPDLNELLSSDSAKKLMNDRQTIDRLKTSPETRRLMELLGQQASGSLDDMAQAAAKGESAQLIGAMQKLLRDPEGQKLLGQISRNFQL